MRESVRAKVIEVDFAARRRLAPVPPRRKPAEPTRPGGASHGLERAPRFVVFWRPPARRAGSEYLGGRWDWGWTLFVWTSDAAVGPLRHDLVRDRGYVPQHMTRDSFSAFLRRASDVGGLLLDGELDSEGNVIRAEADQLIGRADALDILAS